MAPRYSIIPADAIDALDDMPLRVLLVIGTHTDDRGWCRVNQRKLGERLGVVRETVNRAIRKLCEKGFLQKHDLRSKGQNICSYRVVMDRGEPTIGGDGHSDDIGTVVTPGSQALVTDEGGCDASVTTPCDRQAVTTQRPIGLTNYSVGRERELDDLQARLIEAGGEALADPASAPGLLQLSPPRRWLANGCDLEMDILPAIRARTARAKPRSIGSWEYFTRAVADAKASREAPMEAGQALAAPSGVVSAKPHWRDAKRDLQRRGWEALQRMKALEIAEASRRGEGVAA